MNRFKVQSMEHFYIPIFLLSTLLLIQTTTTTTDTLSQGSSLSVERAKTDILVSANGLFSAGFFPAGENAFCFSVWFSKSLKPTVVWTANRDQPVVNGRASKLSLTDKGNLVLLDAGSLVVWSPETPKTTSGKLKLNDNGNLVLEDTTTIIWESFKSPTDTLVPGQELTMDTILVSSRSNTDRSSGYYRLFYDADNVLKMLFQGPNHQITSVYWPSPWLRNFENGRSTYNSSKTAVLNSSGNFSSSDNLKFSASDCGGGHRQRRRRLTLDSDGNLRLYSLEEADGSWAVTWQAFSDPCMVHGICGPNSFCTNDHVRGRRCHCARGFRIKNSTDFSYGCEPEFRWENYTRDVTGFLRVENADFYGYDRNYLRNRTLRQCRDECLELQDCQGFQFKFDVDVYLCLHKAQLLNGHQAPGFNGDVYVRVTQQYSNLSSYDNKPTTEFKLHCPTEPFMVPRDYKHPHESRTLAALLWISAGLAAAEFFVVAAILSFLFLSSRKGHNNNVKFQDRVLVAARFQEFTYAELRDATRGFRDENMIGAGSGGTVYRGTLPDGRAAAIKRLRVDVGDGFSAEVGTLGRLHHMNLIEMWGYCTEGKHRLLVYEYMEHGSLSDTLNSTALDWGKRFEIAVGTARGLAYLHEECLEWVLHCDVKPQNILLSSEYQPKVADFGLSKLLKRGVLNDPNVFSRIRGTRGYMAPEWVTNQSITSKVDVYSYGIVVLELVTGWKPTTAGGENSNGRLVTWMREKKHEGGNDKDWVKKIADPKMEGEFGVEDLELVVKVALKCVEEDKEERPTMKQVVEMLQYDEHQLNIV